MNIIVDLTIIMFKFDLTLHPENFNCRNNLESCAVDAAKEYVFSEIYIKKHKKNVVVSYTFDH